MIFDRYELLQKPGFTSTSLPPGQEAEPRQASHDIFVGSKLKVPFRQVTHLLLCITSPGMQFLKVTFSDSAPSAIVMALDVNFNYDVKSGLAIKLSVSKVYVPLTAFTFVIPEI